MVELDHRFTTQQPIEDSWALVLDRERLVPCVQGGSIKQKVSDDKIEAEIRVKMGAMSMRFAGTVTITERDNAAHRARLRVESREVGGSGRADAEVTFTLGNGEGTVHTAAQISGKAASMGEGPVSTVVGALIADFVTPLRRNCVARTRRIDLSPRETASGTVPFFTARDAANC